MPAKCGKRVKKSLKRSSTPISSQKPGKRRSFMSRSAATRLRENASPCNRRQQNTERELSIAQSARRESMFRRQSKIQTITLKRDPSLARYEKIVATLGLIPGDRAMEFAMAYDSIGPLLKLRQSLDVVPPIVPVGGDKFNLMYVPGVFSPAMRKMRTINKFAEEILMGQRRNIGVGCNNDVRAEVKAQINKLNDSQESSIGNQLGNEFKRRKSNAKSLNKKRVDSGGRRTSCMPSKKTLIAVGVSSSSVQRSDSSGLGSRRLRKACSTCAQRDASNTASAGTSRDQRPVLKRHKGTNTGRKVACRVLGATYFTDPNNLPIFYKHIKLNPWM